MADAETGASVGSDRLVRARRLTDELVGNESRLRFRHHHMNVVRAWRSALDRAPSDAERSVAARGYAEAWARLAHWSGTPADAHRARRASDEMKRIETARASGRDATAPSRSLFGLLKSIVADVRRAYPDVKVVADSPTAAREAVDPERSSAARPATKPTRTAEAPASPKVAQPTSKRSPSRRGRPFTVVIDPGHGGRDHGATGIRGVREKDFNLTFARALARALRQQLGARVRLTRQRDHFVSLARRVRLANQWHADLFISVHANAHRKESVSGIETYFARGRRKQGKDSIKLAKLVQKYAIREARRQHSSVRSIGIKPAGFQVLRGVRMPAVLIETGFLTHRTEAQRLVDQRYQGRLVKGIVKAVQQFVGTTGSATTSKFADMSRGRAEMTAAETSMRWNVASTSNRSPSARPSDT